MILIKLSKTHRQLLPYDGTKINFLAKNLRITARNVFIILSVISVTADEFVSFLVNERIKNRMRIKRFSELDAIENNEASK